MKKKYIVIAHDLGGAEYIYTYIQSLNIAPIVICSGPAKKIFHKFKPFTQDLLKYLEKLVSQRISYEILIGTGWSDYEINWMKKLSENLIKFSVILDNWIYFRNRFFLSEKKEYFWPEKIYVLDDFANKVAINKLKVFVPEIINLGLNNNLHDVKTIISKIDTNFSYTLRYISQPLKELNNYLSKSKTPRFPIPNVNQHEVFLDLNRNIIPKLNIKFDKWIINPHPSEDKESLKEWRICIKENKFRNSYIEKFENSQSELEIVFGFNSSALLKSSFKASFVYSLCDYISWEEKLPHPQIRNI